MIYTKRGFTLLELLVIASVTVIIGAMAASIFISVSRAYNKANIITEIEQNRNLVLTTMSNEIRNALSVSPITGDEGNDGIEITDQEGEAIRFCCIGPSGGANGYIARRVGSGNCNSQSSDTPMTDNDPVTGVNVTTCDLVPDNTANPPVVAIAITFAQPVDVPGRIDFQAETTLETTVSLRTYK